MLKNISLENFRNHINYELDLGYSTVIVGNNGAGKTNILESIVFLSFCRSFREDDKKNVINHAHDFARIRGDNLEVFLERNPRLLMKVRENGAPRKVGDFIGLLPTVIFSPETISIISGSPGSRRRFLDIMISQVDREYLRNLIQYKKIQKQRNSLLQRIGLGHAQIKELDFWDDELVSFAKKIEARRGEAVSLINESISTTYQTISGEKRNTLQVNYLRNHQGDLMGELARIRNREIGYGGTILGPHRDDLEFNLNSHNMNNFASRGELKSAILALKVCELKFLENALGRNNEEKKPILLLDDIFSEFDPDRRKHLSDLILEYQSVITSTEKEHLSSDLLKKAKVVELKS